MPKMKAHAHVLVAQTALELTAATYETLMGDNRIRAAWKAKHPGASEKGLLKAFIRQYADAHIPHARATLTGCLLSPTLPESEKERIVEALALDATLMKGRANPAQVLGATTGETKQ